MESSRDVPPRRRPMHAHHKPAHPSGWSHSRGNLITVVTPFPGVTNPLVRPCVHAVTEPAVTVWPAGQVCLLLENRGSTGIDVSVSMRHRGSDWSKEWEFDLPQGTTRSV